MSELSPSDTLRHADRPVGSGALMDAAADAIDALAARAEAAEAEVTRLKGDLAQVWELYDANQELMRQSKEIGFQFDQVAELAALKASLPDMRRKERERCAARILADDVTFDDPDMSDYQRGLARTIRSMGDAE